MARMKSLTSTQHNVHNIKILKHKMVKVLIRSQIYLSFRKNYKKLPCIHHIVKKTNIHNLPILWEKHASNQQSSTLLDLTGAQEQTITVFNCKLYSIVIICNY
jgi:hypothetical protein